jgi:hypothetical protein
LQGILLHHDRFAGEKEEEVKIIAESFPSAKSTQQHLSVELRWKHHDHGCCDDDADDHEDGYPDLKLEYFRDQDGQAPFPAIGRGQHFSDHPLQDTGLATAGAMIKHCLTQHSKCRHAKPTALPKRVLDVSVQIGSTGIRLHETSFSNNGQPQEFGDYLTLSHCYGSGRSVLKTTTKTLQTYKQGMALSTLPKTFQDAILLTRALGLRWLWIDSLCILTDSASDQNQESSKMDEIFRNSFLTIAATSAAEASEGLFLPKPQPFKIQAIDNHGSVSKIYVREQPSHYSFKAPFEEGAHMNDWELPFNISEESTRQAPLLTRAWCYVERLLSPRILHFTRSEMILECREAFQCECGRITNPIFDSRMTDPVKQEYARIVAEADEHSATIIGNESSPDSKKGFIARRNEALQMWSYIITEYTSRDLTYEEDRLVAIVGIAKTLSSALRSGYIAGHWTFSTLGLLWYPSDSTMTHRPQSDSSPSWSWAAVEGSPILFDNATAMDLACTASFSSERGGNAAWSPFAGDTLELTAAMATEVTFRTGKRNSFFLSKNGVRVDFDLDVIPPGGQVPIVDGETLICVWFSLTFRSSIIGLVLQQSKSNPQVHQRVGRFECYECRRNGSDQPPEDYEALFGHWFPEVTDMTQLDNAPHRKFLVV